MSVVLSTTYTGNGATSVYAIPFDYDTQDQVVLSFSAGSYTYTFPSAGFIQLAVPLANGVVMTIARSTNIDAAAETFQAATGIQRAKLNRGFRQMVFAMQELYQMVAGLVIAAGAIPIPGGGNIGKVLVATTATAYAWGGMLVANLGDASANAKSLMTAANYAAMKVLLGLDQVTNTTDAGKPVSTAQQAALNLKMNILGGGVASSRGRIITVASDTTITVVCDWISAVDASTNFYSAATSFSDTINLASANGISALDTGTIANNTWYYVHAIYNPTTVTWKALLSASFSAPTMPSGYTARVRLGTVRYGTAKLVRTQQFGRNVRYVFGTYPANPAAAETLITSGIQGTIATPVLASFNVDNFFPFQSNAKIVVMMWNVAGSQGLALNNATYTTVGTAGGPPMSTIQTTGTHVKLTYEIEQESHNLFYACNVATSGLHAIGWEELD